MIDSDYQIINELINYTLGVILWKEQIDNYLM